MNHLQFLSFFSVTISYFIVCVLTLDNLTVEYNSISINNIISDLERSVTSLKKLKRNSLNKATESNYLYNSKKAYLENLGYFCNEDAGWHKLNGIRKTWNRARKSCQDEGGHLAIINSDDEAHIISRWIKDANFYSVYIGIHDQFEEGDWITVMSESINKTGYKRWLEGLPNNYQIYNETEYDANCGTINQDGEFIDVHCNRKYPYICEYPLPAIC